MVDNDTNFKLNINTLFNGLEEEEDRRRRANVQHHVRKRGQIGADDRWNTQMLISRTID